MDQRLLLPACLGQIQTVSRAGLLGVEALRRDTIEDFLALARLRNFTHAASIRGISQPALSKNIRTLERELGFSLYDRKHNAVTPAGDRYKAFVECMFSEYDEEVVRCREISRLEKPLRFAISPDSESFSLLEHLGSIEGVSFEKVELDLMTGLPEMLWSHQSDLVSYCDLPPSDSSLRSDGTQREAIQSVKIGRLSFSIYAKKTSRLGSRPSLARDDLRNAWVAIVSGVSFEEHCAQFTRLFSDMFGEDLGFRYKCISCASYVELMSIDLGEAVTIAPCSAPWFAGRDDMSAFDKVEGKPMELDEYLWYLDSNSNPMLKTLLDALGRESAGEHRVQ